MRDRSFTELWAEILLLAACLLAVVGEFLRQLVASRLPGRIYVDPVVCEYQ